jgi:peptidoglycan/xylan/chitin deacetylase (PgdA/CDA1 family)
MAHELTICLHGIGTAHDGIPAEEAFYWVTRQAFTTLLDKIVERLGTTEIPVVITFDDGNASDALVALPELTKRGLKAKFFICAGRIGATHYLDRVAITELIAAGMEIGTHGKDHRNWRWLDETTLNAELGEARRCIEDVCGMAVTKAAIPFGAHDRRVLKNLRREPLACVYTSDRGVARADAWMKSRDTMDRNWSEPEIMKVLAAEPSLKVLLRRKVVRLYKRLR